MTNDNGTSEDRQSSAHPEDEDFRGKYESGRIGQKLLDGYFQAVRGLLADAEMKGRAEAIEIGCGEGLSTLRLRQILDPGIGLRASEFVPRQVEVARANNPDLSVIEESIYELTHEPRTFDVVFLLEVLEHLDYPDRALREVARVLRPGGYLIAGVPREPLWRVLNMARGKYIRDLGNTPGHLNHWSSMSFKSYIRSQFGEVVASRTPIPWTLVLARRGGSDSPTPEA